MISDHVAMSYFINIHIKENAHIHIMIQKMQKNGRKASL